MATEAALEILNSAYDAFLRCGDFMTCADPRGHIRASNILFDACLDAGMPYDEADHTAWAGERVTAWLFSGPVCEAPADARRFVSIAGDYWPACAPCADAVREAA